MPQYDMKKATENASLYAIQTQPLRTERSNRTNLVAENRIELVIPSNEPTSASHPALSTASKELALQSSKEASDQAFSQSVGLSSDLSSGTASSLVTASASIISASPEPVLATLRSEEGPVSTSSPKAPRTPNKKKERDAAPSLLKSNKKASKPQPSFPANYSSVTQSSDLITIFIDGSNLFYAASHLNIEVDYRRLLASLVRGRRLLRAYFYTGVDPQNEKQRGFLLWLNRHGHRVVSKELTNLPDGSRKANMHVEMAVDMMRISEYCPNITLLGGDGNLAYALQLLSQRGIFIEVVSLQSMTSDSLIDLADSYTDLADLRDEIKR